MTRIKLSHKLFATLDVLSMLQLRHLCTSRYDFVITYVYAIYKSQQFVTHLCRHSYALALLIIYSTVTSDVILTSQLDVKMISDDICDIGWGAMTWSAPFLMEMIFYNGTITEESCNWIEFIYVAQCQMTPLKVGLHADLLRLQASLICSYNLVLLIFLFSRYR